MSALINSLSEWLNLATANLSAPAQERIKLEIESHFQEAVESHCAEGLALSQAQARALVELGGAKAAARSFRKRHLTITEAKVLLEFYRYRHAPVQCLIFLLNLLVFSLVFYFPVQSAAPRIFLGTMAVMNLASQTMRLWLSRCSFSPSRVRLIFTFDILGTNSMLMFICYFCSGPDWGAFIIVAILSISQISDLSLWFKILRTEDFVREIRFPITKVS